MVFFVPDTGYFPSYSSHPQVNERVTSNSSYPWCCHYSYQEETATTPSNPKQGQLVVTLIDGRPPLVIRVEAKTGREAAPSLIDTDAQPAATTIERLDSVKSRLALSITELADLFGVTRKTVYDWYESTEPRRQIIQRLEILIDVLDSAPATVDLRRLKAVWNIPVSGASFRTVFHSEINDLAAFRTVLGGKLNELATRMVATVGPQQKPAGRFGEAHLAEFDRRADFG